MEKKTAEKVTILRSTRKTLSLEIKRDLTVLVRAPARMTDREIWRFLQGKADWIQKHLEEVRERNAQALPTLTPQELQSLAQRAKAELPQRVSHFAPLVGADYGKITIRSQRSRWGSCSARGNLNFNCLLMLCPQEVRDYIVVHELCHRKHMDHSKAFWAEVERVFPNYREHKDWLDKHGSALIERLSPQR